MVSRKEILHSELAESREALLTSIDTLTLEEWDRPTSNPTWTARQILVHLTQAEPGLLGRMRKFLDGTSQLPPGFDVNIWNARQVAKQRETDLGSLVASLNESRENVVRFLDELAEEQLAIRGWHASGAEMTLAQMFEQLAQHEGGHAKDILTARLASDEC